MCAMVPQIIGVSIVYSRVCSGAHQRKRPSSASLAFVMGIHRWPVNSHHKGPVTRKMSPFDDVLLDLVLLEYSGLNTRGVNVVYNSETNVSVHKNTKGNMRQSIRAIFKYNTKRMAEPENTTVSYFISIAIHWKEKGQNNRLISSMLALRTVIWKLVVLPASNSQTLSTNFWIFEPSGRIPLGISNGDHSLHATSLRVQADSIKTGLWRWWRVGVFFANTWPANNSSHAMDHSVHALSQWEATLHCNVTSHWLGVYIKWSRYARCPATGETA